MYFVKLVPRRVRTAAAFRAADPWNGNAATDFTLEAYKYVPERNPDASGLYALGTPERFGIRSNIDGAERMLPESLIRLWSEGRVAAERLPALLRALEPSLSRPDYRAVPRAGRIAALAWILTGLAFAGYVAVKPAAEAASSGSRRVLSPEQWLQAPLIVGQMAIVSGLVPFDGTLELPAPPRVPAGVRVMPVGPSPARHASMLAWIRDARGHRLVLVSPGNYVTGGKLEIHEATAFTPGALGIEPPILAEAQRRVTDLDVATIACAGWSLIPTTPVAAMLRAVLILALVITGGLALGFTLALPAALLRERRVRAQAEWALAQTGA